jgi:catechol 2,3-dioxygenase-like lactoylglutathione lyase family enzyme
VSAPPARLGIVILAVRELAEARRFYLAAFGFESTVDAPVYCELAAGDGPRIGLYEREAFARNVGAAPTEIAPGALAPAELYLYAAAPEELLRRAVAAGGRLLDALRTRGWGDEVAYLADPDGNVIAIARDRAQGRPARLAAQQAPT